MSWPARTDRREYTLVLLLGAAGAGLILVAVRQVWAHAIYTPPHPLPAQDVAVRGQSLIPLAGALAIAGLAALAAVIATSGLLRRVAGALLSVIGVGAAVTATAAVTSAAVLSAASNAGLGTGASSAISGTSGAAAAFVLSGAPGHAVLTGLFWHGAAVAGALALIAAGLATAWRGPRWPVMSARYEQPVTEQPVTERSVREAHTQPPDLRAAMWDALNRDIDPT
jgi:uncharacterized membrane protein (TIGR02234 family)